MAVTQEADVATERFRQKLDSGFFKRYRPHNTEVDYAKEKEERDTLAVEKFANSGLFQELMDRSGKVW